MLPLLSAMLPAGWRAPQEPSLLLTTRFSWVGHIKQQPASLVGALTSAVSQDYVKGMDFLSHVHDP